MTHEFHLSVPASSCDPSGARHQFVRWLTSVGVVGTPVDDWALVFSELITNACAASPQHQRVEARASVGDDRIVLRLRNATKGTLPKVQRLVAAHHQSGRGLHIVEQLTDGLEFDCSGTAVAVVCWTAHDRQHALARR